MRLPVGRVAWQRMSQQLFLAHRVMRKPATGQHHAAARTQTHFTGRRAQVCAYNSTLHPICQPCQTQRRAVGANLHAFGERRRRQRGDQRVTVHQAHASAIQKQVAPMAQ